MFIKKGENHCELALSEADEAWMRAAMALAEEAKQLGEIPVGALVLDTQGQLIGKGFNRTLLDSDPSAHAEIVALREAAKTVGNHRLLGCTLYVTLEPCPMCAGAILHSRVKRLVFGAPDHKTGAVGSRFHLFEDIKMNHALSVRGSVLRQETSAQLSHFFQARRAEKRAEKDAARQASETK